MTIDKRPFLQILAVCLIYFVVGRLSLFLAIPPGFAAAVWPPSGIALAAVLILGNRVWLGVLLGSFLTNLFPSLDLTSSTTIIKSSLIAMSIGGGAALQAVVGAALVRPYVYKQGLSKPDVILKFMALGGFVGCLINSTWSVGLLWLCGALPSSNLIFSWGTWWVGDSIGVFLFAPLVLTLFSASPQFSLRRKLSVSLPLLLTFIAVVSMFFYSRRAEHHRIRAEFNHHSENVVMAMTGKLESYSRALNAIESFFASSQVVDRAEFRVFVDRLMPFYPGVYALTWNPRVTGNRRGEFEREMQKEIAGYQIKQLDSRKKMVRSPEKLEYFPVVYIEPLKKNEVVLGYDPFSEQRRIEAMTRSRDTGAPVATGVITLIQDSIEFNGIIIYFPLYKSASRNITQEKRRSNLTGFVAGVFKLNEMLSASISNAPTAGMRISIHDMSDTKSAADGGSLIWKMDGARVGDILRDQKGKRLYDQEFPIEFAGRQWNARFQVSDDYLVANRPWHSWIILAGGLMFTSLLGIILLVLTGRTSDIEDLVMKRTTELKTANENLADARDRALLATKAKAEFLANMSHEIRTPLNGIIGMAELLDETKLDGEQKKFVSIIKESGGGLLAIINDILDLSKIEAGKLQIDTVDFDLKNVVKARVEVLGGAARQKGLSLTTSFDPKIPDFVRGDPGRIGQILLNLIGNAIKFTSVGGVTVQVGVSQKSPVSMLLFKVSDTGPGVPADMTEKLFQPFTQADGSTARKFGGTGLGLSICKRLVELMGGEIGVDSGNGGGATFWFTIPFSPVEHKVQAQVEKISPEITPAANVHPLENVKILVAEDNLTNQVLVRMQLERMGFGVEIVNNGAEAVDALGSGRYDLVLMDCQMPGVDGFDATRKIREIEKTTGKHATIIALTANAMKEDKDRCLDAGMDDYLSKPIKKDRLQEKINEWLAKGRL